MNQLAVGLRFFLFIIGRGTHYSSILFCLFTYRLEHRPVYILSYIYRYIYNGFNLHSCVNQYIHIHASSYVSIYICMYVCICLHVRYVCMYVLLKNWSVFCVYLFTHTCVCVCAYECICFLCLLLLCLFNLQLHQLLRTHFGFMICVYLAI